MGKAIQINCLVKDAIQTEVNQRKGYGTKVKKEVDQLCRNRYLRIRTLESKSGEQKTSVAWYFVLKPKSSNPRTAEVFDVRCWEK